MAPATDVDVADQPVSWRSRLSDWWSGRESSQQLPRDTQRLRQGDIPRSSHISEADRARIMEIEAPQQVFGPGRNGPGSNFFYEKLMAPLNPGPERSLLIVGAGLGASARVLHHRYGARVVGLEASATVAGKAGEINEEEGITERIDIRAFNPEGAKLPGRNFDCALVEPLMFAVQHKVELLRELDFTLKKGGQMILLDFVVGALTDDNKADWRTWLESEKPAPKVRTSGEQKDLFAKARLKVRQSSDITPLYAQMLTKAWARCLDRLERLPRGQLQTDPALRGVAELAEYWSRRAVLMETGALKLMRYHIGKAKFGG
jgi:ubiquinone/menaquinone biosynthesis C-methylase UbiE